MLRCFVSRIGVLLILMSVIGCSAEKQRITGGTQAGVYEQATANGVRAREGFSRCRRYVDGWLRYADPETGLIPKGILKNKKDLGFWDAHNAAADNYAFMVLTCAITDRDKFNGRMLDMLRTERRLTCRLDSLPDTWSFVKDDFKYKSVDMYRLMFGASEYIKDGLMPLTEWLGQSPWSDRMIEMLDDMWKHAPIETPYGKIVSTSHEINGEQLQVLSRVYWMTGDKKYLEWAIRLGDYYLLGDHHPTRDAEELRLRDHGCEIVSGLCELYATCHFARPDKEQAYQQPVHDMLDRILQVGRNEYGFFYNLINPKTGTVLDFGRGHPPIADTWGYTLNGFYTVYLIDRTEAYRQACLKTLGNLNTFLKDYPWKQSVASDEHADSAESALNLYNRETIPDVADWIDHEIDRMWAIQRDDGLIEGWHGDGNFARTTIMYCLWKTQGITVRPWREDVVFGAVSENQTLYLTIDSDRDWSGSIIFDTARYQTNLNMPLDWPRINQFPQWYVVKPNHYYIMSNGSGDEVGQYTYDQLREGIAFSCQAGQHYRMKVMPGPAPQASLR